MLTRIKAELGKEAVVVATGGHAKLVDTRVEAHFSTQMSF